MSTTTITAAEFLHTLNTAHTTLDVRTPAECASEGIDGCIALPLQDLQAASLADALASNSNASAPIHLLCQSGRRAQLAAEKLSALTNRDLIIVEGGLNALKQVGAPVTAGNRKVISLERQVRIAAGALVLTGVVLGSAAHAGFYLLSGFVGAGLMFAGITDTCGMAMMLARMPWNRA